MAMRSNFFFCIMLVLSSSVWVKADDILDAKLNALKENAHRRVYSAKATVEEDQSPAIPQDISEEEKALDKKLRQMENELGTRSDALTGQIHQRRTYVRRPAQQQSANWLTPELLGDVSEENNPLQDSDESWIMDELNRQSEFKQEKLTREEEKRLVDQRLKETLQRERAASYTPYSIYQKDVQDISSGGTPSRTTPYNSNRRLSTGPSLSTSSESSFSRLTTSREQESTARQRSGSESRFSQQSLNFGNASSSEPSATSPFQTEPETEPTWKRTRRSPTYKQNPFEEELMPDLKKSIWD